jgi:hypothetical protein
MFCFRNIQNCKRQVLSLWYSKEPVLIIKRKVHYLEDAELDWIVKVPEGVIITEQYSLVSLDKSIVKYKVWNSNQYYARPLESEIKNNLTLCSKKPWYWIGGSDKNGNHLNATELLDPYILAGNRITLQLLQLLNSKICVWRILDETFNEIDFPTNGIIIEYDSRFQKTKT